MNFILILIIFTTILLPIIIYFTLKGSSSYNKNISPYCENDSECPDRTKCVYNPDYDNKLCSTTKYCAVNNNNLTKCNYDVTSTKNTCKSLCNNEPVFSCIQVNDDNPYVFKKDNMQYNIKNSPTGSGWCLPDINPKDNIKCNKYTSDTILLENKDGSYNWGCYCKTNLFTHSMSPISDCTEFIGCTDDNNNNYPLYNKDLYKKCIKDSECGPEGKCWGPNGEKIFNPDSGVCYSKWTSDKDTNPIVNGFCDCPSGTSFVKLNDGYNSVLRCGSDSCSPGVLDPNKKKSCICKTGYISCPYDLDPASDLAKSCINNPMCIKDTCGGDNIGSWYNNQHICNCSHGYYEKANSSLLKSTCLKRCVGDDAICGNRGDCYVTDDNKISN